MELKTVGFTKTILFVLFCSFFSIAVNAQNKWDKMLQKADASYASGDYAKANKLLAKLQKKATKKLGNDHDYTAAVLMREAKYKVASGLLMHFDSLMAKAIVKSEAAYGKNNIEHIRNLIEATAIYLQYGHYVHAEEQLRDVKKMLKSNQRYEALLKPKTDLLNMRILTGQGFYRASLDLIQENEAYFLQRTATKASYVDTVSGKLKTRKLTATEELERFKDYAALLTLKSFTLNLRGDFLSADSAFTAASQWIENNLGKSSIEYVLNHVRSAEMLEKNGVEKLPKKMYEKSLALAKRKYTKSHYLTFEIYEHLLKSYLNDSDKTKYNNLRNEYAKAIKRYFKKNSLYYINLNTIELNAKLSKEKTANLQTKTINILSNNQSIPENHPKRIELLTFLYKVSLADKDYFNTLKYLEALVAVKKALYGESAPIHHLEKIQLANYYIDYTNKLTEASQIYQNSFEAIVKKEITFGHVAYVSILNHMARLHESNDQFGEASSVLDEALDATRAKYDNKDIEYGKALNQIAHLQLKIGAYEKAKVNIDESIAILEKERKDKDNAIYYAKALETKAQYLAINGFYDEAETEINRSQKIFSKTSNRKNDADLEAQKDLASMYIALGKYAKTETLLDQVIRNYKRLYGASSRKLINPHISLGRLRLIKGDYPEAEKIARRANVTAIKIFGESSTKTASSYILLSEINTAVGDYEKAEENIAKAIKIQKAGFGENHIELAKSLSQLALIKLYQEESSDAIENLIEQSKSIIENKLGRSNPAYAEALKKLASVYIREKRFEEAFQALERAKNIWESKAGRRNNINTASIYTLSGDIYYHQRKYKEAELSYEKARSLYNKFFSEKHPEYVKILSKLSKVYYMEGDAKKAKRYIEESLATYNDFIKKYFPALSEREKAKFWNTIKPDFEYYNTLAIKLSKDYKDLIPNVYNNALITKALLLNSSIKIRERIANSNDTSLKQQYNKWLEKKELLTIALSMGEEQLLENEINTNALSNAVEQLEKELSEKSALFAQSFETKNITWQNIANALAPNEVAIEMVRFRYFDHVFTDSVVYAALYVKRQIDKPGLSVIHNGKDLENKYFKYYRNSIIYKVNDTYSYKNYWQPLKTITGAFATVYLSADGVFNQINLETIPTEEGKYVIDNSNIVLVSNTKDIYLNKVKTNTTQKKKIASMFGNPNFYLSASSSGKISPLPGTEKEVEELRQLLIDKGWIADHYMQTEASEDRIKQLSSPKVFHVATHGFFSKNEEQKTEQDIITNENNAFQNPLLRTGLLLTGGGDVLDQTAFNYNVESGILTAYEAMNLNLDQTELVVLSACETGLGDLQVGEGVYGLQRAFMVAGAKTLVMSMFKVDDEVTQKLMVKFYRKWLESGDKRKAFIEAKKEIRNEYNEPIYWGAFIMMGIN